MEKELEEKSQVALVENTAQIKIEEKLKADQQAFREKQIKLQEKEKKRKEDLAKKGKLPAPTEEVVVDPVVQEVPSEVIDEVPAVILQNATEAVKELPETLAGFGPGFKIEEAPVYKILLTVIANTSKPPADFQKINLAIYKHVLRDKTFLLVGHYVNLKDANEAMVKVQDIVKDTPFKVVGMYRGSIISEALATVMKMEFEKEKK